MKVYHLKTWQKLLNAKMQKPHEMKGNKKGMTTHNPTKLSWGTLDVPGDNYPTPDSCGWSLGETDSRKHQTCTENEMDHRKHTWNPTNSHMDAEICQVFGLDWRNDKVWDGFHSSHVPMKQTSFSWIIVIRHSLIICSYKLYNQYQTLSSDGAPWIDTQVVSYSAKLNRK